MGLSEILTYSGLLLTAYAATQEYIRLKLRLANQMWFAIFILTLFLLFLAQLPPLKKWLTSEIYIQELFGQALWSAKYFIVLSLNIVSLFFIIKSSKLTEKNQNDFLTLLHELRQNKNFVILDKLIAENLSTIFKLRYESSWFDKLARMNYGQFITAEDFLANPDNPTYKTPFEKIKNLIKRIIVFIFSKFAVKRDAIDEIYEFAIENEQTVERLAKDNEMLGIKILEHIARYEHRNDGFSRNFLKLVFKNPKSYLYRQVLDGGDTKQKIFLFERQHYEKFDLGLVINNAILELCEENQKLLSEKYDDVQLNETVKQISNLIYRLEELDPKQLHFSNLPTYIIRELVSATDFTAEEKSTGFNLLHRYFRAIEQVVINSNGEQIKLLNYIYEVFSSEIKNIENIQDLYRISIGCAYVSYIFERFYSQENQIDVDEKIEQFRRFLEHTWTDREVLKNIFLLTMNYNGRSYCEDEIHHTFGNMDLLKKWDDLKTYLTT